MIVLKENTPQELQLKVTYEGIPYEGPLAFGVLLDEEVIFDQQVDVTDGVVDITLPKFLANDYEYILETDEGYTDPKPFTVKRTLLGKELKKKVYPVDINKERDENKDERQILESRVDEFYMKNGNRISGLEKGLKEKSEYFEKKHEEKEMKDEERYNSLLADIEDKVTTLNQIIDKNAKQALEDIALKTNSLSNQLYTEASTLKKELTTVKQTAIKSIESNKKLSDSQYTKLEAKITKIAEGITGLSILDYKVDDTITTEKNLWSAFKIASELRDRGRNGGKYVSSQNLFNTIEVSGQDDVSPTSPLDTLTLAAGSNMTITTNASTNTITFASSGGGGGSEGYTNSFLLMGG